VNAPCCEVGLSGPVLRRGGARIADGGPVPPSVARRCVGFAGWIVPGSILALLPKCPACIAVYFAIGSGIGISITTATYIRSVLVVASVGSLLYFAVRRVVFVSRSS
jgi:hypothetical protein